MVFKPMISCINLQSNRRRLQVNHGDVAAVRHYGFGTDIDFRRLAPAVTVEAEDENVVGADQPTVGATAGLACGNRRTEWSCTITAQRPAADAPLDWLPSFNEQFLQQECIEGIQRSFIHSFPKTSCLPSAIAAFERGDVADHRHIQSTFAMMYPETTDVAIRRIKAYIRRVTIIGVMHRCKIILKPLRSGQTFLGMVGYYLKVC
jgi:hypothetical protein